MPKIQLRHDTSANFTSVNPVLLVGEFAYETDTKKIKVGDGTTAYTSLEYFGGDTSAIPELQEAVEQLELDYGSLADKVDELETSLENKQDVLTAGDNIFIGYEVVNPNVQPNWGTVQDEWVGTNVSNLFNTITGNNNSVSFKFRKTANFNNINHYITIKSTKGDSLLSIRRGSDDFTLSVSLSSSNWINIPLPSNTATYEFDVLMVDKGTTQDLYVTSGINGKTYTSLNQALVGWNSQPLNLEFKSDNNNLFQVQKSSVKLYNGTQDPKLVISATVEEPELPENVTTQGNTFNGANQLVQLDASGKLPDDIIPLDKLNQSKALETGGVSTDTDVYSDIVNYAHSTFDRSKFQIVGSPVITDDGIASGFSSSNYIVGNHTTVENVTYRFKVYLRSPSPSNALCIFKLNNPNESTNKVLIYQTVSVSGVAITYANNYSTPMDLTLGKTYYFEFKVTTANLTLTAYNEDFSLAGTTSMDITSPIQAYGFNVGVTNGYKVWPYEFDLKSITAESLTATRRVQIQ